MEYNGWTNWETWDFKLWMDNNEYDHQIILDQINELNDPLTNVYILTKFLEGYADDYVEGVVEDAKGRSFVHDIINNGIKAINFNEIAAYYLEAFEAEKEATEDI
jgi:hypothetical protein|tara:strand:- start:769 stop:1083 length:315 start_codon:yes stop_codon:yes gene_type:complete